IYKVYDKDEVLYDMSRINKTYYGKKFLEILKLERNLTIKSKDFKKFQTYSSKLNLKIKIVNSNN
ncbi:MAG: hypothetical protein KAT57_08315, partial [Candidatus Lokiarchaeota archaeon]|nr:hypothetical protein [Candidatus Lokiarchaeota archaeon]